MGIRILVVEDEAEIADFLVRGPARKASRSSMPATAPRPSTRRRRAVGTSCSSTGSLPDDDGLAVLRRDREAGGDMPVLVLTARDAVSDRVRGLDSGADDDVCKPFAFEKLLARIRPSSVAPGAGARDRSGLGDLKVDLATHRVERAGKPIDLTAKEQALLVFFLRHPGEILSRARIYEQVWDERHDGTSNTLEVHVMELRKTLEARGTRLLQTVLGRGYSFGDPPIPGEGGLA